jgi:hypothetical protein
MTLNDPKTWDAKHVHIGFALVIMLDNDLVTRPYTLSSLQFYSLESIEKLPRQLIIMVGADSLQSYLDFDTTDRDV